MAQTIKFNVGSQKYEVSRSLLAIHTNIMLAKSVSNQWQEDPESEIFMERDGTLFRYVLTYLRDGKVHLPFTVSKQALIDELSYYGVEAVGEANISDKIQGAMAAKAFHEASYAMKKAQENLECASVAIDFMKLYMEKVPHESKSCYTFRENRLSSSKFGSKITKPRDLEDVNEHLKKAGLNVTIRGVFKNNIEISIQAKEPTNLLNNSETNH